MRNFAILKNGKVAIETRLDGTEPRGAFVADPVIPDGYIATGISNGALVLEQWPTPESIEADVQALAAELTQGSDRDKALALVLTDLVARAFNLPIAEARAMVRDRFVTHLRNIRGI